VPPAASHIIVTGPTSVGKTAVAVALARRVGGRVVSADSMQIYRWMDIGTAKPTLAEMAGVPHYMISVADPRRGYSVAVYLREAAECIRWLGSRDIPVIVCGGTRLYIRALTHGLFPSAPKDAAIRERIEDEAVRVGVPELHARLARVDPPTAARVSPNDFKRIQRALEVWDVTGIPISRLQRETTAAPGFRFRKFALVAPREVLYERVNRRVDEMMDHGWLHEVRGLLDMGVARDSPAMGAHGYPFLADHIEGRLSLDDALAQTRQIIRNYVKYQLMWIRQDRELTQIDTQGKDPAALAAALWSASTCRCE
jgi:tRNA dimethylallyltransferase